MSHRGVFWLVYGLWLLVKVGGLKRFLSLPTIRGEAWFFDAPLEGEHAPAAGHLRREYRRSQITVTVFIEILALADALFFSRRLSHLILVQLPLFVLLTIARSLLLRSFMVRARGLVAPPRERVAYSLKPRRLRDYTSWTFEILNGALALGAAAAVLVPAAPPVLSLIALLLVYVHVGLLLFKRAVLGRPVVLPPDHTDEYLQLAEDAFRVGQQNLDALRALVTFVLVVAASSHVFHATWRSWRPQIGVGLLIAWFVVGGGVALLLARRSRRLLARVKALQGPLVLRRGLDDPENLGLGGFVYWNADNPAVFVSGGPLRLAVNLLNRKTYVFALYWLGLAVLLVQFAGQLGGVGWRPQGRPGVKDVAPLLVVSDVPRSMEFYRQKLGFVTASVHGDPPSFAILSRGGFRLMLTRADAPIHIRPHGPDGKWDVYVSVTDVAAEAAAIQKGGVRLDKGPTDTFYEMREIEVLDPDGYRICLGEPLDG